MAAPSPESLVVRTEQLTMAELCLAYLEHAEEYYRGSTEYANLQLAMRPISELYANRPAVEFGVIELRTVRDWWLKREVE